MRVLVIGGSGFIGGALVTRLRELGDDVSTFRRGARADYRGDRRELPRRRDELRHAAPDAVVDTIAYSERDAAESVEAFRGIASRLVVLSSQDVYAPYGRLLGLERGAPAAAPSSEDSPLRASRFPYRATAHVPEDRAHDYEKVLVEQAAASEPSLPATILRLPCVWGPDDPYRRVGQVLDRLRAPDGDVYPIERARMSWRWTRGFVGDVADAIALATRDARATGRTYNVGEQSAPSEAEWIARIGRAAGWRGEVRAVAREELPTELAGPPYDYAHDLVADTTRIRRELGFRERTDPDEAMRRTVEA
ncbi:MAG TPA: NAD-dependent epimerase/dehydratase family protein [Thermoanaerobaculia bacterium]|nr:NAD-dependent epimerase/dehydratase family protein [Thermoanaerobaculia bacterium]